MASGRRSRPLGNVGRRAHGDPHFGLAEGRRIIDAVARHPNHMPRRVQVRHHEVFALWICLWKAICARQKIASLVGGSSAPFKCAVRRMFGNPPRDLLG